MLQHIAISTAFTHHNTNAVCSLNLRPTDLSLPLHFSLVLVLSRPQIVHTNTKKQNQSTQAFADLMSVDWNNTGRPFYPGRRFSGPNASPIAQHPGQGEGRPGGRGGGADPGGSFRVTTKPLPPAPTARVEAGILRPTEPASVLAGRIQDHLHALTCLFFNCSKHGER